MPLPTGLKLGALAGPNTFGGQAAQRMQQFYPEFTELLYFPTFEAGLRGNGIPADAMCAPEQMAKTGFHPGIQARVAPPEARMYVIAEVSHEYHCSLLAKPGTSLEDVRKVLGHTGSVTQSRPWLQRNLPGAEIVIVDSHSMGAAQDAAKSDGTIASVGTPEIAKLFGLVELAKEIDGGSVGQYWALCPRPLFADIPTVLVVAVRFGGDGQLTDLMIALGAAGFNVATIFSQVTGRKLFEYDYVLRFSGRGALKKIQDVLIPFSSARLVGAFERRE